MKCATLRGTGHKPVEYRVYINLLNGDTAQPHNQQINVDSILYRLVACTTECCAVHFGRSFQISFVLNRILKHFKTLYSKRTLK